MNLQRVTVFKCGNCNDRKIVFEGSNVEFKCPFCSGQFDEKDIYPVRSLEGKSKVIELTEAI